MATDVVTGLGGCLDYEVTWDAAVVERLVLEHGITAADLDRDAVVVTERDLVRSILGFLRDGVGGERYVASSDVVETFAARFERRTTVGGTAVRASLALARLGVPSTVHLVSIDDQVRSALPPLVHHLCSADRDSTDPHLIVQSPAGARVRAGDVDLTTEHPDRLIYVHDPPNREMVISPHLGDALAAARVVLLSNFNAVQDAAVLDARLADVRRHLTRLPEGAVVVFEDAGYHRPDLASRVRDALVDVVGVWSMNEDEAQAHLGRPLDLLDAPQVAAALEDLAVLVPARTLVLHTRCWAAAVGADADALRPALASGTALAGTRYLHGDAFTPADHARTAALAPSPAGARLAQQLPGALPAVLAGHVTCVPGLALSTAAPTTIGLGDTFVGGLVLALAHPELALPSRTGPAGAWSRRAWTPGL